MSNITQNAVKQIHEALNETDFTTINFEICLTPEKYGSLVEVTFLDNKNYQFQLSNHYKEEYAYKLTYNPGEVAVTENVNVLTFSEAVHCLKAWATNIKRELLSSSYAFQEIEKLKKDFELKLKSKFGKTNPDFTSGEISKIKQSLSAVIKDFEELKKDNKIKTKQLSEIKRELNTLKNNLGLMPKKAWIRSASGKIWSIGTKILSSSVGQNALTKLTDKLIEPTSN
ncbi:MAG: hypothetical protein AAGA18_10720 [Verrucomicrobiota bacterium]